MKEVVNTVFKVGLEQPVRILHITDVHLTEADEYDDDETKELMLKRKASFAAHSDNAPLTTNEYFAEAIRLAEELGALLVVTGDVIDIHSHGNVAEFHRIADGHDMMFAPGGHETQKRIRRTMEEEYPYWETVRPQIEAEFPEFDFLFESRVINGLNIITVDNSLDYFAKETLERFRKELDRGLPIILFMHDPMHDGRLNATEKTHPNVRLTEEDYRISHEMIDLINSHELVKATFSGHAHINEERIHEGKPDFVTAGLYKGICRLIEII